MGEKKAVVANRFEGNGAETIRGPVGNRSRRGVGEAYGETGGNRHDKVHSLQG